MKIGTTEITQENFNELLQREVDHLNTIRGAKILHIEEGDVVEFHELNRAMAQNAERYRLMGRPYGRILRLEHQAEMWYHGAKQKARLDLIKPEIREKYTSDELRKGYVEDQAQKDYVRWMSVKSLRRDVEIERGDSYKYSNRLEKISGNLRAEMYANR